jgi:hypothetical protein
MSVSVAVPTTRHHWIHHNRPHTARPRRRHSLTDLDIRTCDCPAYPQQLDSDIEVIIDELHHAHIAGSPVPVVVRRNTQRPTTTTAAQGGDDTKLDDGDDDTGLEEDDDDNDQGDDDYDDDDGDGWCMWG